MSDFLVLAKKEVKNLIRDKKLLFGLIIVPLIVYPALGRMMQFGFESATKETHVAIVNFDDGKYGELLIKALNASPNVSVTVITAPSVEEALKRALQENQNVLVVIPPNFSESIESDRIATVEVYGVFKGLSSGMRESVSEGRINAVISVLSEEIARLKVRSLGARDPEAILHPIRAESRSYFMDRIINVPPTVVSQVLASQSYGLPLIVFLMVMITSQMAAGAVASEKENKTLETLLTLPVKRTTIVASKITGTAVMGVIAALAYMIGLKQYMASFGAQTGVSLSELGLSVTPAGLALFGVVVFLTIAFSLSLAMLLAVFAEDVQSANTVVSSVILPLAFPTFILSFVDVTQLPPLGRYLLLASPFTHPTLDYRYILMGDYGSVAWSILYLGIAAGVTLYATARIFASEKVLTARIRWGRKRRGG
ncbi:ABC transporter permease [Thermococcus sp. AM4]|uniref:ABC transporter permease n=1 Tax=Thermococcus sp. (strain AM4) TaxID=246969 RepID=UPI000187105A|nr:ABC transporter permease [Thermococcus sp. AM4]EEB73335.1 ABC-type sodium efflux pump system permease component [Thermococcus sp. AM4]